MYTCVSVWKITGYMHVIIGLAVIKIRNINKSLISLVGLHVLAAQHLQSTLHNQHFWHHGGKVPAIKLALGIAILTHHTSFLANNVSTAIARYSLEWPANLLSASWLSASWRVSELVCRQVILSASWLSASWFVSEMFVKLGNAPLAIDRLLDVRTTNTMNISLCIYKQGVWNMLHIALGLRLELIQYYTASWVG